MARAVFFRADPADALQPPVEEVHEALAAGGRATPVAGCVGIALLPLEAHAGEPFGGLAGVFTKGADEVRVGAATGNAHQVFEHVVDRVVAHTIFVGFVGKAHLGIGETRVAASAFTGRFFNEDDVRAGLAGRDGGSKAGNPAANHAHAGFVGGGRAAGTEWDGHGRY